jgi:hypothetical protein
MESVPLSGIEKLANPKTSKGVIGRVDEEVLEFLKKIQKMGEDLHKKLSTKTRKVEEMGAIMEENKVRAAKEIDDYFDGLIKELNERRERLKDEYIQIEQSYRKKVIRTSLKLKTLTSELAQALTEVELGVTDFGNLHCNLNLESANWSTRPIEPSTNQRTTG